MNDNQLIAGVISVIKAGMNLYGMEDMPVKQSYQPTQQGANNEPTIYMHKVGNKRYGFNKRKDVYNPDTDDFDHIETQYIETTFQINALARQNPADINSATASDIVNAVAAIMQGDYAMGALSELGIGILRITEVRNPYFHNDRNQFEASPSFDFTVVHKQTFVLTNPAAQSVEFNLVRV